MSKEKEGFRLIGFYAPETIIQKIAEVAREQLCSKSDVCRKAVLNYLEEAVLAAPPNSRRADAASQQGRD